MFCVGGGGGGGNRGFAYASFGHVLGYIVMKLLGVFFIYQMGQSLGKVWGEFSSGTGGKAA